MQVVVAVSGSDGFNPLCLEVYDLSAIAHGLDVQMYVGRTFQIIQRHQAPLVLNSLDQSLGHFALVESIRTVPSDGFECARELGAVVCLANGKDLAVSEKRVIHRIMLIE